MHAFLLLALCALAPIFVQSGAPGALPGTADEVALPAETSVGRVGQRQSRETASAVVRTEPMARIDSRIANRIQSRIRNRLDRDYRAVAGTTSAFDQAGERTRAADVAPPAPPRRAGGSR